MFTEDKGKTGEKSRNSKPKKTNLEYDTLKAGT